MMLGLFLAVLALLLAAITLLVSAIYGHTVAGQPVDRRLAVIQLGAALTAALLQSLVWLAAGASISGAW